MGKPVEPDRIGSITMRKPQTRELLWGTVTVLILLLISILAAKALDRLDWKPVIIGSVTFAMLVCGVVTLVLKFQHTSHQEEIQGLAKSHRDEVDALSAEHRAEIDFLIQKLQGIIPPPSFKWLLSDADVARIEAKVKAKEIWIVSPDLHFDVIEGSFQALTKRNFVRGITYTYIVPKEDRIQARVTMLQHVYADYLSQVKIRQVPKDELRVLAIGTIDFYDPYTEHARVFLQLPVAQRGYWIEVSREDAHSLIGRFRRIAEDESLC